MTDAGLIELQEAVKLASMGGGGVEVEGKSASIKSISDSIQSSMAVLLVEQIELPVQLDLPHRELFHPPLPVGIPPPVEHR
ncbi:MAG: hypothetical protein ACODUE_13650 [Synechococcus sp.]